MFKGSKHVHTKTLVITLVPTVSTLDKLELNRQMNASTNEQKRIAFLELLSETKINNDCDNVVPIYLYTYFSRKDVVHFIFLSKTDPNECEKYMLYLLSSSFIVSHNIVCLAHMYTGSVFIATPTIIIVKRAKKSPVSDLKNTIGCICILFHFSLPDSLFPSGFEVLGLHHSSFRNFRFIYSFNYK